MTPTGIRRFALTVALGASTSLSSPAPVRPVDTATQRHPTEVASAELPLAFEPNQGQSTADVQFLTRAPGLLLQLTDTGMRMLVNDAHEPLDSATRPPGERAREVTPRPVHALRFTWLGADRHAAAMPESPLPGTVNYLKGRDPAKWRSGIPTYARVRYAAIYPGIDVVYYGNGKQLEYDLVVAPHADSRAARLAIAGAAVALISNGDLELALSDDHALHLRAPLAYQDRDGRRVPVEAGYRLSPATTGAEVSFQLGEYDPSLPVIIDPLVYSRLIGGQGGDVGAALAVNAANERFLTGSTADAAFDFPTTLGAFDTLHNGDVDVFVTRLNSAGTALVYSTFLGGRDADLGQGIAVSAANEAFVTGATFSAVDFPTTAGAFDRSHNGGMLDAFVTRLNSTGTALVYSTFLGASGLDLGWGIAVNAANEAFVTGSTQFSLIAFPTTSGAFQPCYRGIGSEAFITRLNSTGTALIYSTLLGGTGSESGAAIAVNAGNEAFVTGHTSVAGDPYPPLSDFPTTAGAFDTVHHGRDDVFVTRLNSTGAALVYSTFLGGNSVEIPRGIAINAVGEAFVTGYTLSVDFPTTAGAFDSGHNGMSDAFVTRLHSTGASLVYSTFLGGSGNDDGRGIAVNAAAEAFVVGVTASALDFPTTAGAFDTGHNGMDDAFVTRLSDTGTALDYSTFLGGSGNDGGYGIAVNAANEAFVTGETVDAAVDFPVTPGAWGNRHNGGSDAFIATLATGPPLEPQPPTQFGVTAVSGNSVTFGWVPPTAGPPPTGYLIEGGLVAGQVLAALALGPAQALTLALPSGSFYLRVRTLAGGAASTASNEVLAHVNVPLAPSAPANLLGLVVGDALYLSWTNTLAGGEATTVTLDVAGTLSGSVPLGLTDTFSFEGVQPGTYTLTVRASNGSGSSVASNPVTLTFPGGCSGPPQPVTSFVAFNVGATLFLSWDTGASGPAPTSYLMDATGAFVGIVPTALKRLSGVVAPGAYTIAVVAANPCGISAPTATQTVIIP